MEKKILVDLYVNKKKSSFEISKVLKYSEHKINYWLSKYNIKKRSISEAIYNKCNPYGDPFKVRPIKTLEDFKLLGLGLGLYWGEGTKSNQNSLRLGNTVPRLIKQFIKFLEVIYGIDSTKLRFGLQIFNDMSEKKAIKFWLKELETSQKKFQKVIITPARGRGTYRNKTKYGVLTVYFHNKKLRDIVNRELRNLT